MTKRTNDQEDDEAEELSVFFSSKKKMRCNSLSGQNISCTAWIRIENILPNQDISLHFNLQREFERTGRGR